MGQYCGIQIGEEKAETLFKKYQNELNNSWKLFDDVEETLCVLTLPTRILLPLQVVR